MSDPEIYQQKPVVAMQYDGYNERAIVQWSKGECVISDVFQSMNGGKRYLLRCQTGFVLPNDWVLKCADGIYRACSEEEFRLTYTPKSTDSDDFHI